MKDEKKSKIRAIALYLPQYHPIPENNLWWGPGFTEWSNVTKAKPLFYGHYQPKLPTDLGFYDLRLEETRIAQAQLAKDHGIEGFCYWHYWFGNNKRLLERPFSEVLASGRPDFPFCLGWANHTWKAKTWSPNSQDKILIEQIYPNLEDYTKHFYALLPAFQDSRYIRINNKPFFLIWDPNDLPNAPTFIEHWNKLAIQNGLEGIHFDANVQKLEEVQKFISLGFDTISLDLMLKAFQNRNVIKKTWYRILRASIKRPKHLDYLAYVDYYLNKFPDHYKVVPTIVPNFDHTARSGKYAQVLTNSTPENFSFFLSKLFVKLENRNSNSNILIIRSWNEWAEGNYLEPDVKYGQMFLKALKTALESTIN